MLLMSQNLARYMPISENTVIRINLAWIENLDKLEASVSDFSNDIFIDIPVGRTKPPNNTYSIDDLKPIFARNKNIRYLAISNVESPDHIKSFIKFFGEKISIIPKIETKKGIDNILEISKGMVGEKIIMLDHDDLFSDLIRNGVSSSKFFEYIEELERFCKKNSVRLLKTRGVIFSDKDKYNY